MRAMAYDAYGSDDVLTLRELPDPKVGPGEVRIRVRRAGVNPVDCKVMAGGLDVGGRHASVADPSVLETGGSWFWVRPSAEGLAELARIADAGRLRVPVADVLPPEQLPAAFTRSREGHVRGTLVIALPD